ncbi:hypothetical protein GGR21_000268 [Dysgonomonas hofstadii]|uniref:DUF3836 domain-containing protein n=1 Tax=Dysgonomonas hofstadii TaxID=637886 RepID=A0A840CRK7_9BACT|nr:DUF3836 domain-containing protein [Dysgonomonas hofstadii]MBB4034383.1 hypothetical protein [Dysgonomonas hofstadii]
MKTLIISSVLAALVSVASLSAGNPKTTVYENIETTDAGVKKEYISYNTKISQGENKIVYIYNSNGVLASKTVYNWNTEKGWVILKNYDYKYNVDGKLAYLNFTKWENNRSVQAEQLIHIYDNEGNFMAVEKIDLNGEDVAYASQK